METGDADEQQVIGALYNFMRAAGFKRAANELSNSVASQIVEQIMRQSAAENDTKYHSRPSTYTRAVKRRSPARREPLGGSGSRVRERRVKRRRVAERSWNVRRDETDTGAASSMSSTARIRTVQPPARDGVEEFLLEALARHRSGLPLLSGAPGGPMPRRISNLPPPAELDDMKQEVIDISVNMQATGLVLHTSGNVSVRVPGTNKMLITPTGMDYKSLSTDDIVLMGFRGDYDTNGRKPSSEWPFHGYIYERRPDAGAVVHTHSTYCTTMACLRRDVPAFHYMIGAAGGATIRCADYATFGTQELSDNAVAALEGRNACLLANHGMISLGKNLKSALKLAEIVENLCEMYWRTLQATGPVVLDDQEMATILEKFKTYGKQSGKK